VLWRWQGHPPRRDPPLRSRTAHRRFTRPGPEEERDPSKGDRVRARRSLCGDVRRVPGAAGCHRAGRRPGSPACSWSLLAIAGNRAHGTSLEDKAEESAGLLRPRRPGQSRPQRAVVDRWWLLVSVSYLPLKKAW